jgi:hypothetical protein
MHSLSELSESLLYEILSTYLGTVEQGKDRLSVSAFTRIRKKESTGDVFMHLYVSLSRVYTPIFGYRDRMNSIPHRITEVRC